jgi:phosphoglycolate phosphatase
MITVFKPKLVMIDVDGTLVDSVPDLAWCVDETMKEIGLPVRGESIVRQWVGNGVVRLMERAVANDLDAPHDQALFAAGMPIFNALYADNNAKRSGLYDGVNEGLAYLKSLDLKVGCVTNKDERFTLPILTDLGIIDEFEIVISGESFPEAAVFGQFPGYPVNCFAIQRSLVFKIFAKYYINELRSSVDSLSNIHI